MRYLFYLYLGLRLLSSSFSLAATVEMEDPNLIDSGEMHFYEGDFEKSKLNFDSEIAKQEKIFKEIVAQLKPSGQKPIKAER